MAKFTMVSILQNIAESENQFPTNFGRLFLGSLTNSSFSIKKFLNVDSPNFLCEVGLDKILKCCLLSSSDNENFYLPPFTFSNKYFIKVYKINLKKINLIFLIPLTMLESSEERITYANQRLINTKEEKYLQPVGPPNSPPINLLRLNIIIAMAMRAKEQNMVTENAKLPGTTTNLVPLK
ncbi:hypothetical protein BpHYR1_021447 [Brachionus plicatilis]|uniref:Uncharacterized protein n=1 Tax=Brachionus plicatilis TaxID=10195 RepID=A0A3M7SUP8_BRAPC|nr:hypothetical protein BpHYR1_021447 [Brachionus plicatilis]